jgi:glycosyltransferase involved in cell wall biosynthesis
MTIAAVVVNYNYGRFLPTAIDSVLAQREPFSEVIVVDDGSTDDSLEVISAYSDRVKIIAQANSGQLGACRAGLAAATADYVYFLDADDLADERLVETVTPLLTSRPVKIQFQLQALSDSDADLQSIFPTYREVYAAAQMREDNDTIGFYVCPPTSGNVYSRSALLALPLEDLDQRDFIDGPATLALPYVGEVASVNAPLARYRLHGANHSQWSEPTVALLEHEKAWFARRWEQVMGLVPESGRRQRDPVLYHAERDLMIAALREKGHTPPAVLRMVRALLPTHLPVRQKVLLTGWALGLLVPAPELRRSLVRARRSPLNRSSGLRKLVRLGVRGSRTRAATNV